MARSDRGSGIEAMPWTSIRGSAIEALARSDSKLELVTSNGAPCGAQLWLSDTVEEKSRQFRHMISLVDVTCMSSTLHGGAAEKREAELRELVTFTGCEHLLRASRLFRVLHRLSRILDNSTGSADTFEMSEPVTEIDVFLSHNWCVSRWEKFLCLAFHFNLGPAALLTAPPMLVIVLLNAYEWFPTYRPAFSEFPLGMAARIAFTPLFLFFVCFYRDLCPHGRLQGPRMFLDKTSIHQVDMELQGQGIQKLGAFMCKSRRMVVLCTEIYFEKLWTIYEVASFLALHPQDRMVVIPTHVTKLVFSACIFAWVGSLLTIYCEILTDFYYCTIIVLVLDVYIVAVWMRGFAKQKARIREKLQSFRIQDALCAVEEDRPVVNRNVALLMRAADFVEEKATDEEALEVFNAYIRQVIPTRLAESVGPLGIPYKYMLVINTCAYLPRGLDMLAGLDMPTSDADVRGMVLDWGTLLCSYVMAITSLFPLVLSLALLWAGFCVHLSGFREVAFMACGMLLLPVLVAPLQAMEDALINLSSRSSHYLVFLVLVTLGLSAAFLLIAVPELRCCSSSSRGARRSLSPRAYPADRHARAPTLLQ